MQETGDKPSTEGSNKPNFALFTSSDLDFLTDELSTEMDFLTETEMVSLVLFMSFARAVMQQIDKIDRQLYLKRVARNRNSEKPVALYF